MAATGKTQNLGLGIFEPNDFTSWETVNENMEKIDAAVGANNTEYEELNTKTENNTNAIGDLRGMINNTDNSVQGNTTQITLLNSKTAMLQSNINRVEESVEILKTDMSNLTDLVGDLPPNLSEDITDIKQKNNEQDTAIETAQSEANTATEAANNALKAVEGIQNTKPAYENSIMQYATAEHAQYFNGSSYTDISLIDGNRFRIQLDFLTDSDDPYLNASVSLFNMHGVIYLNNQQISGTQNTQNAALLLKPSAGGTLTSGLSAILRYINERKTAWNMPDFTLKGYIIASGEVTSYPVEIGTNDSGITVSVFKKGSQTQEADFNFTRAEIHF